MFVHYQALLTLLVASIDLIVGLVIYIQDPRNRTNFAYALFSLSVAFWGFSIGLYWLVEPGASADILARCIYFAGGSIAATFFYFSYVFGKTDSEISFRQTLLIFLPTLIFVPLYFSTDLIIAGSSNTLILGVKQFIYGPLRYLFDAHLWVFFTLSFFALLKRYRSTRESEQQHTLYIIFGTYAVLAIAAASNVIAPIINIYDLIWIGPVATIIWILVVAYAVIRHQLFHIRTVATELLMVLLWLLLLGRTALSLTLTDLLLNGVLFVSILFLGIFLIRNVIRESKQREHLEKLTKDLEKANARLTELDRQKSEFIGIAAHQLRTPIAAIKGYSSLVLEGSYGKTTKSIHDVTKTIFDSSARMADTIADFLNVSRIEQGRMEYHKEPMDIEEAVKGTVDTFQLAAKEKKLKLTYTADECPKEDHMIYADPGKIQHVINNLLDNSIKYTPEGSVAVHLSCNKEKKTVRVEVKDTGAGIPKDSIGELFVKFVRARNAQNINVTGSGLGLYVARQMIEAHGGKIWAESEGEGKGSTFIFELPLGSTPK